MSFVYESALDSRGAGNFTWKAKMKHQGLQTKCGDRNLKIDAMSVHLFLGHGATPIRHFFQVS